MNAAKETILKATVLRGNEKEGFTVSIEEVRVNFGYDCSPVTSEKGDHFITVLTTKEAIEAIRRM